MSVLLVESVGGVAWVQDGGRPGRMHEGVPPGGALVPSWLAAANAAVGNPPGAAGLEIFGLLTLRAEGAAIELGGDDGPPIALSMHSAHVFAPRAGARVGYVAVAGGIGVPVVLGGRGTLPTVGLGGLEGRALRRGDRLPIGGAPRTIARVAPAVLDFGKALRVVPGPDPHRFAPEAFERLVGGAFTVGRTADRTGFRLGGPALGRRDEDDGASMPMRAGALQVPKAGEAIVLGPDHPTTGGYPVLALVLQEDLGSLFARPSGASVRFALAR